MFRWDRKIIFVIAIMSVCLFAACGKDKTDGITGTAADANNSENVSGSGDDNSSENETDGDGAGTDNDGADEFDEKLYVYVTADRSVGLRKYEGIEYIPYDTNATEAEINASMEDTLKYFQSFMEIDELTDEIVAEFYEDYSTVEDLYNAFAEIISHNKQVEAPFNNQEQVLNKLVETCDIFVDLTAEAAECYSALVIHYNALAVASVISLDEYMNNVLYPGVTDWQKRLAEDAAELTCRHKILLAIAEAENITISDSDYQSLVAGYMEYYGYDSLELFEQEFTKEQIVMNMLEDSALEYVMSKAIPVN